MKIINWNVGRPSANNVDHISISQQLIQESQIIIETCNLVKKLSDHIGIMVSF